MGNSGISLTYGHLSIWVIGVGDGPGIVELVVVNWTLKVLRH